MVKSVSASFGLLKRLWSLKVWYSFWANVSCVDLGNTLKWKKDQYFTILNSVAIDCQIPSVKWKVHSIDGQVFIHTKPHLVEQQSHPVSGINKKKH